MHFTTIFASAAAFLGVAQATYVSYDTGYDDGSRSLGQVSCSDGPTGLMTKYHYQTQGQVPGFPSIGGMQGITWGSGQCGTCWQLSYNGNTIKVVALDAAYNGGFNIGLDAMNKLTGGNAVQFGHVDATVTQLATTACGLPF